MFVLRLKAKVRVLSLLNRVLILVLLHLRLTPIFPSLFPRLAFLPPVLHPLLVWLFLF
jgi:hypothetical protein